METANVNGSVTMDTSGFDRAMERVQTGLSDVMAGIQSVEKAGNKMAAGGLGLDGATSQIQAAGAAAAGSTLPAFLDGLSKALLALGAWATAGGAAFVAIAAGIAIAFSAWNIAAVVAGALALIAALSMLGLALQIIGAWALGSGVAFQSVILGVGLALATWNISALVTGIQSLATALDELNLALQTTAGNAFPGLTSATSSGLEQYMRFAEALQGVQKGIMDAADTALTFGANLATILPSIITDTAAAATNTTTKAENTAATAADTVAKGAETAATGATTGATWAFNISLSANPIGAIILAVMALVAVIVLLINYWPQITAFALAAIQGLMNIWNNVVLWFKTSIIQPILDIFSPLWTPTIKATQEAIQALKNAWAAIVAWFDATIIAPIAGLFTGLHDFLKKGFTVIGTTIGNAVGGALKGAVNAIIGFVEGTINTLIRSINGAIGLINLIPGVNIKALTLLSIPRMAQGGVISRPTVAMIGEAGREAVLPLENNTGWMAEMARQLAAAMGGPQLAAAGGDILIPVYLDGNMLDQVIVSAQERRNLRSNGR